MSFLSKPLYQGKMILCIIGYLILVILKILLLPIVFILPYKFIENFDDIVINTVLKILWVIWCGIKLCFFIVFALILMLITPVLIIWPPLCVAIWVWAGSIKIF